MPAPGLLYVPSVMRVAMGSGAVLERSTPVLTFSPGVREQPEPPAPAHSRVRPPPAAPQLRPLRSNLPIIPGIARRSTLDVGGLVGPLVRVAGTSGGRTAGKLLAIAVALAALGLFAGLNMRSLTVGNGSGNGTESENAMPTTTAQASVVAGRVSDATASERLQARGTLAPRKEARAAR
ncbi:MAG TPA: hypothetical protein VF765_32315 [Polyangiaceae bacterium]